MDRQNQIDLRPDFELMGWTAAVAGVAGGGTTLIGSGLLHLNGRRILGGFALLTTSLVFGLGLALGEEIHQEEALGYYND